MLVIYQTGIDNKELRIYLVDLPPPQLILPPSRNWISRSYFPLPVNSSPKSLPDIFPCICLFLPLFTRFFCRT